MRRGSSEAPARPLFWLRSERDGAGYREFVEGQFIEKLHTDASRYGFNVILVGLHDVILTATQGVNVNGDLIEPGEALFHLKPLRFPPYVEDFAPTQDLLRGIRLLGHATTCSPENVDLTTDKWSTLEWASGLGIPTLPTMKIHPRATTERDLQHLDLDFPVVVKPADWGGGNAIISVGGINDLARALRLYEGYRAVITQHLLMPPPLDVRVYCVRGIAERAMARSPSRKALVSNYYMGGGYAAYQPDSNMRRLSELVARSLGEAYVCVDWLVTEDGSIYLNEVELDGGAIGPDVDLRHLRFRAWATIGGPA